MEHAKVETSAEFARVEGSGYESLNAEATKKAYDELSGVLDAFADTIVHSLDQMVPHLATMQSLLSQRGFARKEVLKNAGLPGWTVWAAAYAAKFECSVRTIQDRINLFRAPRNKGKRGKPLRLDYRQQSALIKAQLAINDVVAALKNDGDWQKPLAEYEKVAVTPVRLESFVNTLSQQTDWEDVLRKLVDKLAQYSEGLPTDVIGEMHSAEKLLEGGTSPNWVVGQEAVTQPGGVASAPPSGLEPDAPDAVSTRNEGQETLQGTVCGPGLTSEPATVEPPMLESPNDMAEVAPLPTPRINAGETPAVPESPAPERPGSVATECPPPQSSDDSHPVSDVPACATELSTPQTPSDMVWTALIKGNDHIVNEVSGGYGIYEEGSDVLLQWYADREEAWSEVMEVYVPSAPAHRDKRL